MKIDELKSYLNMTGWGCDETEYYIKVYRNGYTVAEVGLWERYSIKILDPTQMTDGLYRRLSKFAHTQLEKRSDKKTYNVILPLDGEIRQTRYLQRIELGMTDFKFDNSSYGFVKSNPELYAFTEQEIKDIDERYFLFAEEVKK